MQLSPGITALATVGNGTLLAAALLTTNILRTGPTGAFTDTFDTAQNIVLATGPGGGYRASWEVTYVNDTNYVATLAAGTNVTLAGFGPTVAAYSQAQLLVQVTSKDSQLVTITVLSKSLITQP